LPENDTDDLALLSAAALEAGEIARRHFGSEPTVWQKAEGQGPVSEADLAIDAMLRQRLLAARPGFGWLSEETEDDPARLTAQSVFIIDPIDGTRAFLSGQKGFAHALAIARAGRVTAAVVHLPLLGLTYSARSGGGAFLNDRPILVPPRKGLQGARILASRPQLAPALWPGGLPAFEHHFRPSLAWRICLVAEGRFHGAATLRDTWDWDTAAATLIAQEAGARVSDRFGEPLEFNTPRPLSHGLLVGPEGVHLDFLRGLQIEQPRPHRA
jgi:myo-inositol-1(or 4)-monophosphatase